MNQRHLAFLALASASVCAVVFTACGGGDDNNNVDSGDDATSSDVVTSDSPQGTDTGTDTGSDGGTVTDGATIDTGCAPGPNCQQCCLQKNLDAALGVQANVESCACTTPGDCKANAQCGNNLCKGNQANQACNQCLDDKDSGDCRAKAAAACFQDPSCQPLAQCVIQCQTVSDAGGGGG